MLKSVPASATYLTHIKTAYSQNLNPLPGEPLPSTEQAAPLPFA